MRRSSQADITCCNGEIPGSSIRQLLIIQIHARLLNVVVVSASVHIKLYGTIVIALHIHYDMSLGLLVSILKPSAHHKRKAGGEKESAGG